MAEDQQPPSLSAAIAANLKSKTGIISVVVTLLLSMAGAGWSGLTTLSAWAGHHADRVIETHIESVKNTDSAVKKLTETTSEIADTQKQQGKSIEGIHQTLQSVQQTQQSIDATLKRMPYKPEG